ncbi:MAG TPA: hypothetical protein ENJ78_01185 [candidate division WWE3 bacterium]|uniref:DUF5673 domain-containing protein n=1 Tax=candidate division WWE3 bacterium TaxID=2053526 RepID=A0A7V5J0S4_UNCKA|nr:hypothetical protein [candidate division WWE3 bacterium]
MEQTSVNQEAQPKKPIPKKTLLIWEGYARPFKKKDKKYFTNLISTAVVIIIFLLLAGQFTIIIAFLSLLFASYALYSVPPQKTTYVITNKGIELEEEVIPWERIKDYFVSEKLGHKVINLNLYEGTLSRRYLLPDSKETLQKARKILNEYLAEYIEPKKQDFITKGIEKIGLKYKE